MRSLLVAGAVAAAVVSLGLSLLGMATAYRSADRERSSAATHEGPQWIGSGHRAVLLDPAVTENGEAGTTYPAFVSADREAIVDVREVR